MHRTPVIFLILTALAAAVCAQTPEQSEFFEKKVRPLLVANCQGCHNAKVKTSGLDLSTIAGFQQGGASGALVSKDDPKSSLLLKVTSYEDRLKMPPTGKLKDEDMATLKSWIAIGAPWPGAASASTPKPAGTGKQITDADRQFWAFRPIARP